VGDLQHKVLNRYSISTTVYRPHQSSYNDDIARMLLDLYFVLGSTYYEGRVGVAEKTYTHIKSAVTHEHILEHLCGKEGSIGFDHSSINVGKIKSV